MMLNKTAPAAVDEEVRDTRADQEVHATRADLEVHATFNRLPGLSIAVIKDGKINSLGS